MTCSGVLLPQPQVMAGPLLLDPNVLIALLDAQHCQHRAVLRWFRAQACGRGWATCPASERLVMAVLTHPECPGRLTLAQAAMRLLQLRSWPGHQFWAEAVDLVAFPAPILWDRVADQGAVTDLELLLLAIRHAGVLVTLGRCVQLRALRGSSPVQHWQRLEEWLAPTAPPIRGLRGARLPATQG